MESFHHQLQFLFLGAQTTLQWEKFYPSHMAIIFELGQVEAPPGPGFGFEGFEGFAASAFASGAAFAEAAVGLFQLVAFVALLDPEVTIRSFTTGDFATGTASLWAHFCVEGTFAAGAIATPVVRNVLAAVV